MKVGEGEVNGLVSADSSTFTSIRQARKRIIVLNPAKFIKLQSSPTYNPLWGYMRWKTVGCPRVESQLQWIQTRAQDAAEAEHPN